MTNTNKTTIEQYIIKIVKDKRLQHGFSQAKLAALLDVSYGFIGKVESMKYNNKYNINHINKLAEIFKCSPKDFLPNNPLT